PSKGASKSSSKSASPPDVISPEAATRAFERMIDVGQAAPMQELALTDHERMAMSRMSLSFHPVWHVRNKLITGYRCALSLNGKDLSLKDAAAAMNGDRDGDGDTGAATKAKVDAMVYANAVAGVQGLLQTGQKALLIVPIHFSTVDHMRYIAPLLEAGGSL